ncbi:MAG: DUF3341 domain-containing protein [Planctomycetota bacterium]
MSQRLSIGVFEDEHALMAAAAECRERGVAILDAFSPYPIHGIDAVLGLRRSRLPIVCFAAGLSGLAFGLWLQYWASATDWPLDVGGKPFDSLPAFMPVAFELMVLCAGLATALCLLARARLAPARRPKLWAERVTDDRFALVIAPRDQSFATSQIADLLRRHGARQCREEVVD